VSGFSRTSMHVDVSAAAMRRANRNDLRLLKKILEGRR